MSIMHILIPVNFCALGELLGRSGGISVTNQPTVVFCFDGLDFRYLNRFRDVTPTIDSLRGRGVVADLRSSIPPWTGCAWPTFYTGVGPGHHGAYGFFSYDGYPDTAEIVTRDDVRAPAIWTYLTDRGRRTVVVNMPVTYPAEPIDGVLIPGYLAPEEAAGHPPGIRDDLATALGEPYRIYAEDELSLSGTEKLDAYCELIDLRGRAAAHLLATQEWEVAFVQLQKTDSAFHQFTDESAFQRVYEAADGVVERVLDAVNGRPNVILCSDHGIGPATGYSIHVNDILRADGLVRTTARDTAPSMRKHRSALLDDDHEDRLGQGARFVGVAATLLRQGGIDPANLVAGLRRLGLGGAVSTILPADAKRHAVQGVEWTDSHAYCRVGSEMGVRLNVVGREPDGIVSPSEYESVRSTVIDRLASLTTPDGDPAFAFVEPREAIYEGPAVEAAPDVIFLPTEMEHVVSPTLVGAPFVPVDTYTHKRDGVFLAAGPAFDGAASDLERSGSPSRGRPRLDILDVAPIIFGAIDCPVPERLEGSVPPGLLEREPVRSAYTDLRADSPGTDHHRPGGDVTRHLEDLGYL